MFSPSMRLALFIAALLTAAETAGAQEPNIDTKSFRIGCERMEGNSQRGLKLTRHPRTGFTAVLSDAAHRYYNAPGQPGLRYWLLRGDVAQLTRAQKPVAAFGTRNQRVQFYGALEADQLYTLFVTSGRPTKQSAAARAVFKARRCSPIGETAPIPNELRHDRPKPLA
jgi:hypothetical protein